MKSETMFSVERMLRALHQVEKDIATQESTRPFLYVDARYWVSRLAEVLEELSDERSNK
jgi:hypothetical protein